MGNPVTCGSASSSLTAVLGKAGGFIAETTPLPDWRGPRIPREIPNWRAKAILATMGLTAKGDAIIASLPEPQRTVVTAAWGGDAKLSRAGATVTALGQALGMSAAEIDALFIAAEAIEI